MAKLPENVRRSLSHTEFDWRTAEGVAKDAGLALPEAVKLLDSSPEVSRAVTPNGSGKALYRLKPQKTFLSRVIATIANAPA